MNSVEQVEDLLGVEIVLEWRQPDDNDFWQASYRQYSLYIHRPSIKPPHIWEWEIVPTGATLILIGGQCATLKEAKLTANRYLIGFFR